MTSLHKRYNFRWNTNELLALQREYELLEMNIDDIAKKHQRSINSIIFKLLSEGFIEKEEDARGFNEYNIELSKSLELKPAFDFEDSVVYTNNSCKNLEACNMRLQRRINELEKQLENISTNSVYVKRKPVRSKSLYK